MKKELPRISEAEWEVLRLFWQHPELTAQEVVDLLRGKTSWQMPTIKSLINRLVKKGALKFKREGRGYRYSAAVAESACLRAEADSFLDRFFGGSLTPMMAHFLGSKKLSAAEIAQIKKLLENK